MIPFPEKRYSVILADPPWQFRTYSDKGKGRSPEQHYDCMSLGDIRTLPVASIADKDCALFLWATYPMLPEALSVMEAWQFKFKTVAFTWIKQNRVKMGFFTGLGYWTRANPEIVLLGTRGHPKRVAKDVHNLVMRPRREHSQKPERVRNDIVRLMGDVPRIELFARGKAPDGWDVWGLEALP